MAKKEFQTESKKLLDMMINSIYTHKEIFLRELISNASDAIDKLYYRSLTDDSVNLSLEDYEIRITPDKENRLLTISDNGIGMTMEELETNLGTIAKSGSFEFKKQEDSAEHDDVDIIGQFGVGFYSAFMVSDRIQVISRAYGSEEAARWESSGVDGYTIEPWEKDTPGTTITLHLKEDTDDERYSDYLEQHHLMALVKKYSDYIRFPIRMRMEDRQLKEGSEDEYETVYTDETLNSMTPIWKKSQSDVTEEEYARFYQEKFFDFEPPLTVIRQKTEGRATYEALLFIPKHAPYDYYNKDFEKGLQLYSSGVMIMEKCKELLPDHFSFVRGLVDSADFTLNISRETLQHDRQVQVIAKALEKKIAAELKKMLLNDREKYETFYNAFGLQLKFGAYSDYGMHKETLQDLLLFHSSKEKKLVSLREYVDRMAEGQDKIYFASGETLDKISMLPQVETVVSKGYEVLYLTDDVDEFTLQMLRDYDKKTFSNVCKDDLDLTTEEEKEEVKTENEKAKDLLRFLKDCIGDDIKEVRFTNTMVNHPVCLSSEGEVSLEMEKVLSKMPGAESTVKAQTVLEINLHHPIAQKLQSLYENDQDTLRSYTKILYAQARLISGLSIENPAEIGDLVCNLMI